MTQIPAISGLDDASQARPVLYQSGRLVHAPASALASVFGSGVVFVATRTELKALDTTTTQAAFLTEAGREGLFLWRAGNFSSLVTADAAEGIYVKANAIASSSGAWVRQRDNLDAEISWFGAVVGAASGANATANNAAYASAKALSAVMTVRFLIGIYEFSSAILVDRDGLGLQGYPGFPVFGSGGSNGTLIRWTGSSGSVIVQIKSAGSGDTNNNSVVGMEIDGNALAAVGIDIINAQWPRVENVLIRNMRSTGVPVGLRMGTTSGGTGVNCVFRGHFRNLMVSVLNAGIPIYITAVTGTGGTTFCHFENIHAQHQNGAAIYLNGGDDNSFVNCGTNRIAGGTGLGLHFDGTGSAWPVGNTFWQFHVGNVDGVTTILADGAKARQNKIYGLTGVDDAATISITNGAQLFYDFIGTGYSSDASTEGAVQHVGGIKVLQAHDPHDDVIDFFKERTSSVNLLFGGANVGMTYSSNFYRSTRLGNAVMYKVQIGLTAKGSSTGAATITGFPYNPLEGQPLSIFAQNLTSGVGDTMLIAQLTASGSIALYKMASGTVTALTNADITNTTVISLSGVMFTDTVGFA